MGLRRWMGTEQILETLVAERVLIREMIGEIAAISRQQVEVTLRTVQVLEAMQRAYAVDGAPVGRHLNDEQEAALFEEKSQDG